jgi:UDP-4-amino-4,6-dideoxy-N-acetyl-beta-L-altrosamine N-acetyltransferase
MPIAMIDRLKIYRTGNYTFKNFISLEKDMLAEILKWRNNIDVRKWMFNEKEIGLEEHYEFAGNLGMNDQNYYWLVLKEEKPIGVAYLNHLDLKEQSAEWGFYTNPEFFNSFAGFEIVFAALSIFTKELQINDLRSYVRETNSGAMMLNEFFGMEHLKWVMIGNKKYSYRKLSADHISKSVTGIASLVKLFSAFLKNKKVLI